MNNGDKPAFIELDHRQPPHPQIATGLTKREYFAGLAMQGFIANGVNFYPNETKEYRLNNLAVQGAVEYADALLEALEESK